MALANENAVKYRELTDEIIADVKRRIELFVKSEEYWDKFAHHSTVPRGHKTFTSRKVIAPKVRPEDVKPRAEFIAPRPTKIAVATFEKTVENYGDKAIYSKEDLQYHFDDTVNIITTTLKEIAVQKKDFIKGKAFISSRAIITYDTSLLNTLENAAIIFRKNKAKRWDGTHYLAHITPEMLKQLRTEIAAKGVALSEPTKRELDSVATAVGTYGDWVFSVTANELLYKNDTTQRLVLMGKRDIDSQSPVDVSKLEGESDIDVFDNGLGSGVLVDEDGNYTSDDNKQQGSVAINMDGLGSAVSDDLCLLNCEVSVNEIKAINLPLEDRTGFVSKSGNEIELGLTGTQYTEFVVKGTRYDSTAAKHYATGSTIVSVQVKGVTGKALGTVNANAWSATYYLDKADSDADTTAGTTTNQKTAKILAVVKTAANNDTVLVEVPNNAYSFNVKCTATAS